MARYLLLINIGPVQGFIATARRTRDLYAGSRLLSDAAYAIAKTLGEKGLIFPSPEKHSLDKLSQAGIPNVIMGIIETGNPAQLAKSAKENAITTMLETWERVRNKAGVYAPDTMYKQKTRGLILNPEVAEQQISDVLEYYWVALPLERDEDYARVREEANRWMAARKNTRNFNPVTWGGRVQKSSLDGALESVIDLRWKYPRISDVPENERKLHAKTKAKNGIRVGEELSGVDLLKRLYPAENFASTSHIAALPFLQGLTPGELELVKQTLDDIAKLIENEEALTRNIRPVHRHIGKRNPRLLFSSRLTNFFTEDEEKRLESAQASLKNLYARLKKEPHPYYAIILGDGDHMGKIISRQKTPHQHRALSTAVTLFSEEVKRIVAEHDGSLVYSGGDDVLALLPLHTALSCARALNNEFKDKLSPNEDGDQTFNLENDVKPSLSIGIAVVHHLFDLGEALNLARKAEKAAKEKRNSLAVIVAPRSGVELLVKGQWDEENSLDERLATYARWLHEGLIPMGWAYELRSLAKFMDVDELRGALAAEAIRILERKSKANDDVKKILADRLKSKAEEATALANELIVARYFGRAFALFGKFEFKRKGDA